MTPAQDQAALIGVVPDEVTPHGLAFAGGALYEAGTSNLLYKLDPASALAISSVPVTLAAV